MDNKNILAALVAAQAEADNPIGDSKNTHRGNVYNTLPGLLIELKPILTRHGLAVVTVPAPFDGVSMSARSMLVHSSGESMDLGTGSVPINADNRGINPGEAASAAYTTIRRMVMLGVCGVAKAEDGHQTARGRDEDDQLMAQAKADVDTCHDASKLPDIYRKYVDGFTQAGRASLTKICSARKAALNTGNSDE